MTYSDSPFKL
jgi:Phosphatidylinositol-4-phosphate 5-Kinase